MKIKTGLIGELGGITKLITHKHCTDCRKLKQIDIDFNRRPNYNRSGVVYYKSFCKSCDIIRVKKWIEKNKDAFRKYQREYGYNKRREAGVFRRKLKSTPRYENK